jgi:hypothetical protein
MAKNKWARCANCGAATYVCAKRGCVQGANAVKAKRLQAKLNAMPGMGASPAADARLAKKQRALREQIAALVGSELEQRVRALRAKLGAADDGTVAQVQRRHAIRAELAQLTGGVA